MEKGKKIIIWTEPAKKDLKEVFELSGQIDNFNSNYRRLIVGNYKILYKVISDKIIIHGIFDSRQNPKKLEEK